MRIDHTYCINLERSTDRRVNMEAEFERENLEVEFFKGCDGKKAGKNGQYGCAQSHLRVWRDMLKRGFDQVLVFEDDVTLSPNFNSKLESIIEPNGDWDILYLYSNPSVKINLDKRSGEWLLAKTVILAAYVISARGAKKMAYFNAEQITRDYEIDLWMTELPIESWVHYPNNLVTVGDFGTEKSTIGLAAARLAPNWHSHLYGIRSFLNDPVAPLITLLLIAILLIGVLRRVRRS